MNSQKLIALFSSAGIELSNDAADKLCVYAEYLVEENNKINLTAITEEAEIAEKHFLDCALLLSQVDLKDGAKVADVGSGAGFPGMVLKIVRPDINITLLDSLGKRVAFLERLAEKLGIEVTAVHIRAEDAGQNPIYREQFDMVTARAVARLSLLSEYCLPLAKQGGIFAAMKGPAAENEANDADNALKILGGKIEKFIDYSLPSGDARATVLIKKSSQTPPKYPRPSAKIAKKPL